MNMKSLTAENGAFPFLWAVAGQTPYRMIGDAILWTHMYILLLTATASLNMYEFKLFKEYTRRGGSEITRKSARGRDQEKEGDACR